MLRSRVEMRSRCTSIRASPASWRRPRRCCARCPASRSSSSTQPAVGLQSVNLATLPTYKRELQLKELEAARAAGVDALVAVYHSDHRELCAHERDWPFRIINVLEIVGESMGLHQDDHYKHLKVMQDVDAIVADSADLIAQHGLDPDTARRVIVKACWATSRCRCKAAASARGAGAELQACPGRGAARSGAPRIRDRCQMLSSLQVAVLQRTASGALRPGHALPTTPPRSPSSARR